METWGLIFFLNGGNAIMADDIRTESWCGHNIRFIDINGEWYALLKDICDALKLQVKDVSHRLDPDMLEKVPVEITRKSMRPLSYKTKIHDLGSSDIVKNSTTVYMLAVNEIGIYEALFASRRLEARKFRRWTASVIQKLRKRVGLEQYQALEITNKDIQDQVDDVLDSLFWDDDKKKVMMSVTIQGGDVEQIPFE